MGALISWFLMVLGLIALLAIVLVALAAFCYSRLTISLKSVRVSPEFQVNPASVIGALFSLVTRSFISAAGGLIKGVRLDGQINCLNHCILPLFIPAIEHEVLIEGRRCLKTIHTGALWLKPGAGKVLPINITLSTGDIPQVALGGLTHGGDIHIEIQSRLTLGPLSYLRITSLTPNIPNTLSQGLRRKPSLRVRRVSCEGLKGPRSN